MLYTYLSINKISINKLKNSPYVENRGKRQILTEVTRHQKNMNSPKVYFKSMTELYLITYSS